MALMDPKAKWDPNAFPFRLMVTVRSLDPRLHGWANRPMRLYDNLNEAIAEAKRPQGRGVISVKVHEAMNRDTWTKNGKWAERFSRKGGTGRKDPQQ